jgi:hypothetical protein
MTALGQLTEITENGFHLFVPFDKVYLLEKRQITSCEVRIDDGRHISSEQRAKVYALLNDISQHTGHIPEEIKGWQKYYFMADTGSDWFSLSNVDMTTARAFIDYLIQYCIAWEIPCRESLLHYAQNVSDYLYASLWHQKCVCCGGQAVVHHDPPIGMGADRKTMSHVGYTMIALCWKHHEEAHRIGLRAFNELWHIYPVKADEPLVRHLNLGRIGNEGHTDNAS